MAMAVQRSLVGLSVFGFFPFKLRNHERSCMLLFDYQLYCWNRYVEALKIRSLKPEIIYRGIGNESRAPYIHTRAPRAMLSGANRTFNVLEGADKGLVLSSECSEWSSNQLTQLQHLGEQIRASKALCSFLRSFDGAPIEISSFPYL